MRQDHDGEFRYAVLGPKTASESGKPSVEARRFIDETTAADRPRATNRNAVVLAVPSKDGIEIARERVRDVLAWDQVRAMLKDREDVDQVRLAQLEGNLRVARGELASHIVMAFCIVVTVNDQNDVAAFRINVDNQPLFLKILADKRARIESTAINAEALLPGGPFNLWTAGEKSRYVKDLVGAFASTAKLPKMLDRKAILDTLLRGCEAGDFVLQVTRGDKSVRTFWKTRPDEHALEDPSLEVVLSESAQLTEISAQLLAPGALPQLWKPAGLKLKDVLAYFSGTNYLQVDKGGYTEPMPIPAATADVVKECIASAIRTSRIWVTTPALSVMGEDVPINLLSDEAEMFPPPSGYSATELLPQALSAAWDGAETTAQMVHVALSTKRGRTLPWSIVRAALEEGFRLGLIERTIDSKEWPSDLGGASGVKIRVAQTREQSKAASPSPSGLFVKSATAELETNEIQDLADVVGDIKKSAAGYTLKFRVTVELGANEVVPQGVADEVNAQLTKVQNGWRLS